MTNNIFRTAITKAITDQNKTYRDLARDTGISHSMIYFYVSGIKDITSDKLIKLCDALSIEIKIG